ncbi:MAG TPA: winged helix DNA-binding domain-containing protein, partial [Candidatus Acidoferrales bacterium]|nr:winged helix DNA-binding domain-containing protein [Candidatus Acidoferrales bacterium]
REKIGVVDAVERLGGLQAQWAPAPYVALWSRVRGFERDQLTRAIDRGALIKATLMRATLHLVSAREYPAYSFATLEGRFGAWRPPVGPTLADLKRMHASVLRYAARTPRTREEIRDHIAAFVARPAAKDERLRDWLLFAALATSGLVWEAAGARFEHRQLARFVAPPAKLRKIVKPEAAYDLVVRHHLAAFGPASVSDIATWSSVRVPHIREALARLRDVVRFRDENGRELFDLRGALRPHADTPVPVRFLARFDAAILGHDAAERTRILPAAYKKVVIFSAEVWQTFLLDGFVAGRYRLASTPKEATLSLEPFKPIRHADKAALVDEGERLVRFYYPDARAYAGRS